MSISIIKQVSVYLGYNINETLILSQKAPRTYKHYKIKKKKGGFRTIHHPSRQSKSLQYAIIEIVLKELPVSKYALAYKSCKGSPIKKNATLHAKYKYSIRVDFKKFFPSIKPRDLFRILQKNEKWKSISKEDKSFIKNCLFIKIGNEKGLAIGAPSSPIISNVIMYALDLQIQKLSKSISLDSVYTRYADDIIFSTNLKGGCSKFFVALRDLVKKTKIPNLEINTEKTKFTSRKTRRVVTGLFITPDGIISIGRSEKRYIRKLLYDFKNDIIDEEKGKYLSGYLSYILDVEPEFYNRLALKYSAEIVNKALRINGVIH